MDMEYSTVVFERSDDERPMTRKLTILDDKRALLILGGALDQAKCGSSVRWMGSLVYRCRIFSEELRMTSVDLEDILFSQRKDPTTKLLGNKVVYRMAS